MHAFFGGNNWHSGTGAGYHTFIGRTEPWGLTSQISGNGMSYSVCGYDRWFLGWNNPPDKNLLISAKDPLTSNEVNTDLNIISNQNSTIDGIYILRDFVTTGDAIRIKLR